MSGVDHDRRQSSRYSPVRPGVLFGWSGRHGFQSAHAQLINISFGGVAVLDEGQLWDESISSVMVLGIDQTEWVSVSVMGRLVDETGVRLIRLKFADDCPYDLFRGTVFGFSNDGAGRGDRPSPQPAPPPGPEPESVAPPPPSASVMAPPPPVAPQAPEPVTVEVEVADGAAAAKEVFTRRNRFGWGFR